MAELVDGEKLRKVLDGLRAGWVEQEADASLSLRRRDMAFAGVVVIDTVLEALDDPRTDPAPVSRQTETTEG